MWKGVLSSSFLGGNMLDIKEIRKNRGAIEEKIRRKEPGLSLAPLCQVDEELRACIGELETLQAARNRLSKEVGVAKKKGESAEGLMDGVRQIGEKISHLQQERKRLDDAFIEELAKLPNLPDEDIRISQNVEDNVILKEEGTKPSFEFPPKHHLELNEKLHLFDFEKSAKTSGSGWPAYRGMGARLEWALLSYLMDMQVLNGFEPWLPPLLVKPPMMFHSGQLPKFDGQFYKLHEENKENELFLIPTSEVVLNGLHSGELLPEEALPIRYSAYTPCFRREAGAAGAQERGLIRVHQFNKVEMFAFTHPEKSEAMLDEMVSVAEQILKGLGLHYRLSLLVTGDMSFTASKTIDIEVFLPGQKRYYEVSSISNCRDYQARRSATRIQGEKGHHPFVHTLNGSGLATPRLLVALLENNQQSDGSVLLPPVLQEKLGVKALQPHERPPHML